MSKKLINSPKISPQIVQDKKGKASLIILKYKEYEWILNEIKKLETGIQKFKKNPIKKS